MICRFYTDSEELIQVNDRIILDSDHTGVIEKVIEPRTEAAKAYSCEETGGLLILFDKIGLVLEPFGVSGFIERGQQCSSERDITDL
jgi:hypothetical protein